MTAHLAWTITVWGAAGFAAGVLICIYAEGRVSLSSILGWRRQLRWRRFVCRFRDHRWVLDIHPCPRYRYCERCERCELIYVEPCICPRCTGSDRIDRALRRRRRRLHLRGAADAWQPYDAAKRPGDGKSG